ncbi:MAG: hypothetical protein L0H93_20660 [Nocardioides sp.]|nr:hypothetical protein [Nocardioides sp.]
MAVRIGAAVLTFLVGSCTGIASIAVHQKAVPWLLLAVLAPAAAAYALPAGWLRVGFGLGWVLVLLIAVQGRPEGDFAILATPSGYVLLASALALVVYVIGSIPRRRVESGSGATAA